MRTMMNLTKVTCGMSVLDLGGTPSIWNNPEIPSLHITIFNLPGITGRAESSSHDLQFIQGDACAVKGISDRTFDLVFSNSVIEHVGNLERRAAFAREVRRLGKSYWVQTPSRWFPIEAHTGMPFWWIYPNVLRTFLINRWRKKLPAWTDMIEGTTVLSRSEMEMLFPEATIIVERLFAVPKSYVAFYKSTC
jgi:SAM-dependent methyltransferase